jgi:hypothetical protein
MTEISSVAEVDIEAARAAAETLTARSARTSFTIGARRLVDELDSRGLLGRQHEARIQLLLLTASRLEQGTPTAALLEAADGILAPLEALLPATDPDLDIPGLDDPDFAP